MFHVFLKSPLSPLFLTMHSQLDPPLWTRYYQVQVKWTFYCLLGKACAQGWGLTEHCLLRLLSYRTPTLGTVVDTCFVRRTETPRGKEEWETGLWLDKKGIMDEMKVSWMHLCYPFKKPGEWPVGELNYPPLSGT